MNAETAGNASPESLQIGTSVNALIDTTVEVAKSCALFRTVRSIKQVPEENFNNFSVQGSSF